MARDAEPTPTGSGVGLEASSGGADPLRWLSVLWPLAIWFHLGGNGWHLARLDRVGVVQIGLVFASGAVIVRPRADVIRATAALQIVGFAMKLPLVGNHEVILTLASAAILAASLVDPDRWAEVAVRPLRGLLLIAYGAIAASKWNRGFLDPVASCAVVFGDELGHWIGLSPSQHLWTSWFVIVATLLIETAIPVLLLIRPLRSLGVVVALAFHFVLSLDPIGHVFDFSSTLLPLFLLFLPTAAHRRLGAAIDDLRARRRPSELTLGLVVAATAQAAVLASGAAPWFVAYPLWLVVGGAVLALVSGWYLGRTAATGSILDPVARGPAQSPPTVDPIAHVPAGRVRRVAMIACWAVPTIAALIPLGPYLGVRSAASFNMYANLRVVDGSSNHLFLPAVELPGFDRAWVSVVAVDVDPLVGPGPTAVDRALSGYISSGLLIPEENLRRVVADRPEVMVTVADHQQSKGRTRTITGAVDRLSPVDAVLHRLAFRRVTTAGPAPGCNRAWGPLG